jgi:hypothetical protein
MPVYILKDYSNDARSVENDEWGRTSWDRTNRPGKRRTSSFSSKPTLPVQVTDKELTPRQSEVFRAMIAFQENNGHPPTQRELSSLLGMRSEQGVKAHMAVLEAKGYIVPTQRYGHRNKMAVWPDQ